VFIPLLPADFARNPFGGKYVPVLGGLVAAAKQYDDFPSLPGKINPVARAVVYAKLKNAVPERLTVAKVSDGKTAHAGRYYGLAHSVLKPAYPLVEAVRLPYFYHCHNVSHRIRKVKGLVVSGGGFWIGLLWRAAPTRHVADGFKGFGRVDFAVGKWFQSEAVYPLLGGFVRNAEFIGNALCGVAGDCSHSHISAKKKFEKSRFAY